LTRGRAATPDPFDIGAVSRSGELFDALAARRLADPGDDPAARLLAALVTDVDMGAPPLPSPAHRSRAKSGSHRRVVRLVVTLGVTAAVLTSAGAAAAGGGSGDGKGATGARVPGVDLSERSDGSLQVSPPERRRFTATKSRSEAKRRGEDGRSERSSRSGADPPQRSRTSGQDGVALSGTTPELQESGDDEQPEDPSSVPSISVPDIQP
jgi:hypothetical protein